MAKGYWNEPDKKDVAFFKENAGGSYIPGKETRAQGLKRGAIRLAKAEAEASRRGWEVEWREAEEDCARDIFGQEDDEPTEYFTAILRDEEGRVIGSLGCIGFLVHDRSGHRQKYSRVVEAELALEALSEMGKSLEGIRE